MKHLFRYSALILFGILVTIVMVVTGFDARWFSFFQNTTVAWFFSLAGVVGFFMPVVLGMSLLLVGHLKKNVRMQKSAWVTAWAGFFGYLASITLKFFTGRLGPPYEIVHNILEQSQTFQFGLYKGGVFWGWPSSHTATAFAMSVALVVFYKEKKWVKYIAIAYASYIGIGASMSFHWASDVVMGVIVGSIVGIITTEHFIKNSIDTKK